MNLFLIISISWTISMLYTTYICYKGIDPNIRSRASIYAKAISCIVMFVSLHVLLVKELFK